MVIIPESHFSIQLKATERKMEGGSHFQFHRFPKNDGLYFLIEKHF